MTQAAISAGLNIALAGEGKVINIENLTKDGVFITFTNSKQAALPTGLQTGTWQYILWIAGLGIMMIYLIRMSKKTK